MLFFVLCLLVTLLFFLSFEAYTISRGGTRDDAVLMMERLTDGGIVSPNSAILLIFAAFYVTLIAGLRRLSLVGLGYRVLAERSLAVRFLTGVPEKPAGKAAPTDDVRFRLANLLDFPTQHLPWQYVGAIAAYLVVAAWAIGSVATMDGRLFSCFLTLGSATAIAFSLLLLAQGAETWRALQSGLAALGQSRVHAQLAATARFSPWGLSLALPGVVELLPLARRADHLRGRLLAFAKPRPISSRRYSLSDRRVVEVADVDQLIRACETTLKVRPYALKGLWPALAMTSPAAGNEPSRQDTYEECVKREITTGPQIPLLHSAVWQQFWTLCDALVEVLRETNWKRSTALPALTETAAQGTTTDASAEAPDTLTAWFAECETIIAMQFVFLLREILARVMSSVTAAMACLTLVTAAHLLYLFQGRTSFLTVDLFSVTGAALVAVWMLISMEKNPLLSKLRHTTPGHIDFNWEFIKRVAVYGLFPLIAVVGALFPEVQQPLLGWIDPLRKLVSF